MVEESKRDLREAFGKADSTQSGEEAAIRTTTRRIEFVETLRRDGKATTSKSGTFVLRDGELVEKRAETKGNRVTNGVLSNEEAWTMHERLIRRQHFGRRLPNGWTPEPM